MSTVSLSYHHSFRAHERLMKRQRTDTLFRGLSCCGVILSLGIVVALLGGIVAKGYTGFFQTRIQLDVALDTQLIDKGKYQLIVLRGLYDLFPEVTTRGEKKQLRTFLSVKAGRTIKDLTKESPHIVGTTQSIWLVVSGNIDQLFKGNYTLGERNDMFLPQQLDWYHHLRDTKRLQTFFNHAFFTNPDSSRSELAGLGTALKGSFLSLSITLVVSLIIGVGAAVYLEELAPRNLWTDFIEININNLAAVPSIVFGILGLAVFIELFGMPRSTPLVGGLILSLMTMPTITIAARASLRSVPQSIRNTALELGASRMQMIFDHLLLAATPGILTGSIIGMAQALGETAPLLMIGMVAFVKDVPEGFLDAATALPAQVYRWSSNPHPAYEELTAAGMTVIILFAISMNSLAIILRKLTERR